MTDDEPDRPAPPKPPHGCWLFAGLVLAGVLGFAGAVVAGVVFNAPFGVIAAIMFGTPGLYIVALCVLSIRHTRKYGLAGTDLTPEQRAAAPLVTPLVGAFLGITAVAIGGVIAARVLNAPVWVTPVAFLTPGVMFSIFAWPYLKSLAGRIKRAAPSPEKAAAVARTSARSVPEATPADADADEFPTLPAIDTEPGRRLAHRLPPAEASAGCTCLGVLGVAAFWNGIVSVFLWQAAKGFAKGNPEWFLVLFLIPFVLIGLLLAFAAVFAAGAWAIAVLAGTVTVEVDEHPFVPGGRYRGHVAQTGLFRLAKVGVELACVEAATYQSGTTESTDKKAVAKQPAELAEPFPSAPLDFELVVPADAMHSFAAAKNAIAWNVTVWGRVLVVLPYSRSFQVVVRPGSEHG